MDLTWRKRWTAQGKGRRETTWREPWEKRPQRLYKHLTKAQSTALTLLRTEAIGLNRWLASRRVPGITKDCPCGWHEQTVEHVVLHCPRHDRWPLILRTRSERLQELLGDPTQAGEVARWFIQQGILQQFAVARDIENEDTSEYQPAVQLDQWNGLDTR
jgi:hypothetical protein